MSNYSLDVITEMLGGETYYTHEQIMYVYSAVNGHTDQAKMYLDLCLEQVQLLKDRANNMLDANEIEALNNSPSEINTKQENDIIDKIIAEDV